MRLVWVGGALLAAAAVCLLSGALTWAGASAVGERVWPVLLFAATVTVTAELASDAGVFRALAARLTRVARGNTRLLWVLCAALAVVATAFLSLDTTAVLLTPVVVVVAMSLDVSPLPFAFVTVWLANTASLFLPVSNLTNLLAMTHLGDPHPIEFLRTMALPASICVLVTVGFAWLVFRRHIPARYSAPRPAVEADRVLLIWAASIVAALTVLLVSGVPFWASSTAAAVAMTVLFAVRRRAVLTLGLIPWPVLVFAAGLFLCAEAVQQSGLGDWLLGFATGDNSLSALLGVAGAGLVGANLIDNLPAFLLLEPIADTTQRVSALLVGVNAGALITPWASLATLLWHSRMSAMGIDIPWRRYVALGAILAPVTVVAATLSIGLTS